MANRSCTSGIGGVLDGCEHYWWWSSDSQRKGERHFFSANCGSSLVCLSTVIGSLYNLTQVADSVSFARLLLGSSNRILTTRQPRITFLRCSSAATADRASVSCYAINIRRKKAKKNEPPTEQEE